MWLKVDDCLYRVGLHVLTACHRCPQIRDHRFSGGSPKSSELRTQSFARFFQDSRRAPPRSSLDPVPSTFSPPRGPNPRHRVRLSKWDAASLRRGPRGPLRVFINCRAVPWAGGVMKPALGRFPAAGLWDREVITRFSREQRTEIRALLKAGRRIFVSDGWLHVLGSKTLFCLCLC